MKALWFEAYLAKAPRAVRSVAGDVLCIFGG